MMHTRARETGSEHGAVLLAVLWLTVALALIGMTTSYVVRTEAAGVSNQIDSERAALMARGSIDAAVYAILRGSSAPAGDAMAQRFEPGQRFLRYDFAEGLCEVEIVPENAKLNINTTSPEQLAALFAALGLSPDAGRELAEAVAHWRAPQSSTVGSALDLFYASLTPTFEARHAAFSDLDELLAVKGMTRDFYFGQFSTDANDGVLRTPPLADLLTTETNVGVVSVNYAAAEVLQTLPGWNEAMAQRVVEARARSPFRTMQEFFAAVPEAASLIGVAPVTLGAGGALTLTATARIAESNVRRTVRMRVRLDRTVPMGVRVLGSWQDWPWTAAASQARIGGQG